MLNGSRCVVILNQCWKVTTLINCIYANGESDLLQLLKVKNGAIVFLSLLFSLFLFYSFTVLQNVLTLSRIHSINGYSIEVTWDEPVGVKGVIEKYILKASSEDGSNISVVSTEISNTSSCTGICQ